MFVAELTCANTTGEVILLARRPRLSLFLRTWKAFSQGRLDQDTSIPSDLNLKLEALLQSEDDID